MRRLREVIALLALTVTSADAVALANATPPVHSDYSVVLGKPMKAIVMDATYLAALEAAYADFTRKRPPSALRHYHVTLSSQPGAGEIYVRFVPESDNPTVGCATRYGTETLYVIDRHTYRIIRKEIPC